MFAHEGGGGGGGHIWLTNTEYDVTSLNDGVRLHFVGVGMGRLVNVH